MMSMMGFLKGDRMFKKIHLLIFYIPLNFIISINCSHQSSGPPQQSSTLKQNIDVQKIVIKLEKEVPILMDKMGVPGLSMALICDGKIAWYGAFGVTNVETNQLVKEDTVFEAASLSKPVFAYMVSKFVSRGELDLDRPLVEYASEEYIKKKFLGPDFDDDRYKKITARMVLNHSTGFPNWREGNTISIEFEPGQKFCYSAEALCYLQAIVERISNQELAELMKREIFEPLGMTKSSYIWRPEFEDNAAYRHDMMGETRGLRRHKRALAPATLQTTACDYARFLIAVMNGEGLDGRTHQDMLNFQSTYSKEGYEGVDWGLGTGLEKSDYGVGIWQWGDNTYAQAFYLAFPERKIGIVYFANSFYGLALAKDIVDMAISGEHPVMACGIMEPYLKLSKPISAFIQRIQNGKYGEAEDFFLRNLREFIGPKGTYNETLLNDIGHCLLKRKHLDAAVTIFRLNVEAYPNSWLVYDSLGEAYMKSGNKDLAIQNYKKSLKLNPDNSKAVKMLEKLK
jgi:CubicO group peptidase (beta-lactamase class C family)